MSDDPLNDLAVRTRQLEAHLLRSPEYLLKASRKVKWLLAVLAIALVLMFGEGILFVSEPKPASPVVLGSIDLTSLVAVVSCILLVQARRNRRHLNERWLNPEARKTLEALRREHAEMQSRGSASSMAR